MKLTAILLLLLFTSVASFSQGITLLYKGGGSGGWNNASNWVQINTPAGQTPIQRVPTEFDHVIFSKSMSGLSSAGIGVAQIEDTITVGVNRTTGIRCRSMRISNIHFGVSAQNGTESYPWVLVSTENGGYVLIDSNAVIEPANFHLQGGNSSIYDLQIINSSYGAIKAHNRDMGSVSIGLKGRLKIVNSTYGSYFFGSNGEGGELYAENSSFNVNSFRLGASSKTTLLDCSITDHGSSSGYLFFGIGPDSDFTSREVEIKAFSMLEFYTSGSIFNGNISTTDVQGGLRLKQADPARPLPNIINGNLKIFGQGIDLSGGLKISGDLINYAHELDMSDTSHVYLNGKHIFKIGGIANYDNSTTLDHCTKPGCHFSLEFFGDKDSKFVWPVGMPIDTLVIKKSNCAKVSFQNSLYVSGETRIESGQLQLDPNAGIPYKFVCVGDVTIAKGGGIFLRKNSDGVVANMAVAGDIFDQNTAKDSACAGLSNPYSGTIFNGEFTGITLLYKYNNNGGWNNPSNWIQIKTPAGKTPIQRVPTELDDVVFSKSMSGLSNVSIGVENIFDSILVGTDRTNGIRCRSMRISNTTVDFFSHDFIANFPTVYINTAFGGSILVDSSADITSGFFRLLGGNPEMIDLEIINSNFGYLRGHNINQGGIIIEPEGRARMINSTYGEISFGSFSTGGEIFAENCKFNVTNFKLGAFSKSTLLNCAINDGPVVGFSFGIGPNSEFVSDKLDIKAFNNATVYTSGSVLKGNITILTEGGVTFSQFDFANPIPNIIDGNVIFSTGQMNVKGDLKISGKLINNASDLLMYSDTNHVFINGKHIFKIAGIPSFGSSTNQNCTGDHCRFKLELFGNTDTEVAWPVGFPVDTLIINKTNCAKVTFKNSLYVAGETRILGGQLALDPNDTIPYKMVSAGDINISPDGSLFLRKNSAGQVANIAVGGAINDANTSVDTTCSGFANPYDGIVGFYSGLQQNGGLKPLAIRSNSTISNLVLHGEAGTNFFLEKDITVKELRFSGQASLLLGNHSLTVTDSLLNVGPSSFIVTNGTGTLRRTNIGSKETVFPVGTSITSYNPLILTNSGTADHFRVRVQPTVFSSGTTGTAIANNAVNRTWLVEEENPGGSNATLTLQWNAADELPGFSRTAAFLSHFTSGKWDESTPVVATGTNPYSMTRSSLSNFSPFTVFSTIASSVSSPSELSIQVYPNPAKNRLYVQMKSRLVKTTLQVRNNQGVTLKTMQIKAGETVTEIPVGDLPAGIYNLTLSAGAWQETRTFLKQ
ncbi:T9SS type A sorting domain-containing protein [Flavisolibacter sp. BT320]|nr:T9SS type A sorting domain-containing protein [Flavisolibacter longurius]